MDRMESEKGDITKRRWSRIAIELAEERVGLFQVELMIEIIRMDYRWRG